LTSEGTNDTFGYACFFFF